VAFAGRDGRRIRVHSRTFAETRELDLDGLRPPGRGDWSAYIAGVAWALAEAGHQIRGADLLVDASLPLGAGLSSSAALELAAARALCEVSDIRWSAAEMARLCQEAEHSFAGVQCGAMDQLVSALATEGRALLIDCRSLAAEPVTIPREATIVVMNTGASRSLASSAYNQRRSSCQAAVDALRELAPTVESLRDATGVVLSAARDRMDEVVFRRARHVVEENGRVTRAARALRQGDLEQFGRLMDDSHASLRDLYEVSSLELDLATELARAHPACFGARLTGAGFGGCAIALVRASAADAFVREVHDAYRRKTRLPSEFFTTRPARGAHLLERRPDGSGSRRTVE
jgi:galactokinase